MNESSRDATRRDACNPNAREGDDDEGNVGIWLTSDDCCTWYAAIHSRFSNWIGQSIFPSHLCHIAACKLSIFAAHRGRLYCACFCRHCPRIPLSPACCVYCSLSCPHFLHRASDLRGLWPAAELSSLAEVFESCLAATSAILTSSESAAAAHPTAAAIAHLCLAFVGVLSLLVN